MMQRRLFQLPPESSNSTSIKDDILMKLWKQIHIAFVELMDSSIRNHNDLNVKTTK